MEPFEMTLITATAELKDASRARRIATEACEEYVGVVQQSDAWLAIDDTGGGALVRRSMIGTPAVIEIERESRGPVALERQRFTPVADPDDLPEPWAGRPEVVRVLRGREVWLADNVRVYIDTIPGVGSYCAMEAVVDAAHPADACRSAIRSLQRRMEIPLDALQTRTYGEIALGQDAPDVEAEREAEIESMKKKIAQLRDLAEE